MNLFVMVYKEGEVVKAFSSKYLLFEQYRTILMSYDGHWKRREDAVNRIKNNKIYDRYEKEEAEERKQDLLNFIQGKEYQGMFSLEELKNADPSFDFHFVVVDSKSLVGTLLHDRD